MSIFGKNTPPGKRELRAEKTGNGAGNVREDQDRERHHRLDKMRFLCQVRRRGGAGVHANDDALRYAGRRCDKGNVGIYDGTHGCPVRKGGELKCRER